MSRVLLVAVVLFLAVGCAKGQLKFLSVGDWGGQETPPYYTSVQKGVADQMGKTAEEFEAQFIFGLGDNFYSHGISCTDDPAPDCKTNVDSHRFADTFDKVYTAPSLQKQWYILAGNHDHLGNVSAEIAYTKQSDRWFYPSEWYTFTKTIPGSSTTVQFVFIDTVVLAGLHIPGVTVGQPKMPDSAAWRQKAQDQWTWVNQTLQASTADWLIVAGHYPVWSIAEHGPTWILVEWLKPMLEANKVAFYLNGHDHNLQYLNDGSGIAYIDCGAGHDNDESNAHASSVPPNSSKLFYGKSGGFITVEIADEEHATVQFVTQEGDIAYTLPWTNPRKSSTSK